MWRNSRGMACYNAHQARLNPGRLRSISLDQSSDRGLLLHAFLLSLCSCSGVAFFLGSSKDEGPLTLA